MKENDQNTCTIELPNAPFLVFSNMLQKCPHISTVLLQKEQENKGIYFRGTKG